MYKYSVNRIAIAIPRHLRNPIDTHLYNKLFCKKYQPRGLISIKVPDLVHKIRTWVETETGYDPVTLCKNKQEEFVESRQLFTHFIKKYVKEENKKYIDEKIAAIIGKDRTTIYHSEKCVLNHLANEKRYRDVYDRIEEYFIKNNLEPV